MTENNLENRFQNFKQNFKKEIYGLQWENDRKNFDIVYANGKFKSFGKWNFLPALYENQFKDDQLLNIYHGKNIKFLTLGSQKLCLPKEYGNKTLIYANNYYKLVENYINEKSIVCEIGSGSGLFSALINENKSTINILIDIPEVMLSAIAFYFTLFPKKRFLLPNEIEKDKEINFKNFDFIFLLPSQKNLIKNETIDFGINTQSFMEMDESEVDEYLDFFNEKISYEGYFFCSNRLRKRHYFFNYKFHKLIDFKLTFLEKDKVFYMDKNLASMLNILLKKKKGGRNNIKFNILDKINGLFYFKINEFFYWLKKDVMFFLSNIKKKIKS
tara:strand:+ start:17960 stop:18946 length:987 start_codon:yes stop_codon:yes gene_type:complete